ncbi:hypothetical protein [Clostridium hydrogeniformans]|uniref:hypothetical protein n=1 Tax=Clostridium hydrogeniformans TaxID=349933 RepID=UPI0004852DCF|nr:hypothetical protein [Clostridium hydrogeniformans]
MSSFLLIANLILAVLCIVFIVKNILVKYRTSKSKLKLPIVIILIITSLILSLVGLYKGFFLDEQKLTLKAQLPKAYGRIVDGIPEEENIKKYLEEVEKEIDKLKLPTILGYGSFLLAFATQKSIFKEEKKNKGKGLWDLNKFK